VTEAHRCKQLAQGCYAALPRVGFEPTTCWLQQVCPYAGRDVRWPCRVLSPGESRWVSANWTDRMMDGLQIARMARCGQRNKMKFYVGSRTAIMAEWPLKMAKTSLCRQYLESKARYSNTILIEIFGNFWLTPFKLLKRCSNQTNWTT